MESRPEKVIQGERPTAIAQEEVEARKKGLERYRAANVVLAGFGGSMVFASTLRIAASDATGMTLAAVVLGFLQVTVTVVGLVPWTSRHRTETASFAALGSRLCLRQWCAIVGGLLLLLALGAIVADFILRA